MANFANLTYDSPFLLPWLKLIHSAASGFWPSGTFWGRWSSPSQSVTVVPEGEYKRLACGNIVYESAHTVVRTYIQECR